MNEQTADKRLNIPLDQTLHTVFNPRRSYFTDIYQRECKLKLENVRKRPKRAVKDGQVLDQGEEAEVS